MASPKRLIIQQQRYDGSTYTNVGNVVDSYSSFRVVCQEFPFKHLPESKDLPKRDWYDEDGDDVYFPTDGLKFKAYDLEAKFLYEGTNSNMPNDLKGFINFLYGKNSGGSPCLAIFDEYTKTGRRGVYVESVDNTLYFYNDVNISAISQFKVKFRVTDPVTEVSFGYVPDPTSPGDDSHDGHGAIYNVATDKTCRDVVGELR